MNNNLLFKILFILLFVTFKATAVEKIVFVDVQFILSNSSAGKSLYSQIKKIKKQKIPKIEKTQTRTGARTSSWPHIYHTDMRLDVL